LGASSASALQEALRMRIYVVFCPLCSLLERVSARGGSMD
jgi:hypothetical protein